MKKLAFLVIAVLAAYYSFEQRVPDTANRQTADRPVLLESDSDSIYAAYKKQASDIQVRGKGVVSRILADDLEGSRHQKFILKVNQNQTVLVSHNIDLAPRIENLETGDLVELYGEYEWNSKGGLIHWTHHDPNGQHPGGWIKHNGRTYQ